MNKAYSYSGSLACFLVTENHVIFDVPSFLAILVKEVSLKETDSEFCKFLRGFETMCLAGV